MGLDWNDAVIIALGSNLGGVWGSPAELIEEATGRLASIGLDVVARSSLWRSAAWPDSTDPDYLNRIAFVETGLDPQAVLQRLQALEAGFGRERSRPNAPRTLDLDLIAHGRQVLSAPGLILPHPRAQARLFVMGPLAEVAPDWRHPVSNETALALARAAPVGRDARPTSS